MAAKKLTPQQQRDRRAKIMAAGLGVVFVAVLAFELPKLMKGGASPAATSTVPAATSSPAVAVPVSQLTRFKRFAPKNPFRPGVTLPATTTTGGSTTTTPAPKSKPAPAPSKPAPPLTISVSQAPPAPTVPAALLLVDGKKQVVRLDATFPAQHPLFKVVALGEKSLWIQLVAGSLSGGSQTLKLDRGRRVTLEDTTAGVKTVLQLVKPTTAAPLAPKQSK